MEEQILSSFCASLRIADLPSSAIEKLAIQFRDPLDGNQRWGLRSPVPITLCSQAQRVLLGDRVIARLSERLVQTPKWAFEVLIVQPTSHPRESPPNALLCVQLFVSLIQFYRLNEELDKDFVVALGDLAHGLGPYKLVTHPQVRAPRSKRIHVDLERLRGDPESFRERMALFQRQVVMQIVSKRRQVAVADVIPVWMGKERVWLVQAICHDASLLPIQLFLNAHLPCFFEGPVTNS